MDIDTFAMISAVIALFFLALIWIVLASINYKLGRIARALERSANLQALTSSVLIDTTTVPARPVSPGRTRAAGAKN